MVQTVTRQRTEWGSNPDRGKIFFASPKRRNRFWEPRSSGYLPVVKRPGREVDHSSLFNVEVKNEWSYISPIRLYGVDKDTLIFASNFLKTKCWMCFKIMTCVGRQHIDPFSTTIYNRYGLRIHVPLYASLGVVPEVFWLATHWLGSTAVTPHKSDRESGLMLQVNANYAILMAFPCEWDPLNEPTACD